MERGLRRLEEIWQRFRGSIGKVRGFIRSIRGCKDRLRGGVDRLRWAIGSLWGAIGGLWAMGDVLLLDLEDSAVVGDDAGGVGELGDVFGLGDVLRRVLHVCRVAKLGLGDSLGNVSGLGDVDVAVLGVRQVLCDVLSPDVRDVLGLVDDACLQLGGGDVLGHVLALVPGDDVSAHNVLDNGSGNQLSLVHCLVNRHLKTEENGASFICARYMLCIDKRHIKG